jgi:quercetin dioxygenase-like cupin family protein
MPRVLFSAPECRAIVIDLQSGEAMGEHHVRERAAVQVVTGCASVDVSGEGVECKAGTLLVFEPHERHAVQALQDTRLLVILTPWPAPEHYTESERSHAGRLPPNAVAPPVETGAEPSIESSSRPQSGSSAQRKDSSPSDANNL